MTGRFVSFEGGEGAGKSTQLLRLKAYLETRGIEAVTTREPGGSPGAEAIRGLLLGGGIERWDAVAEACLVHAARRDHLISLIRPALARGAWVLCDRFEDSTRAYQGAGGLDPGAIDALSAIVCEGFRPDLTLILDLPVAEGRARAAARAKSLAISPDRFEGRGADFHERVRAIFRDIAAREPARCAVVDAKPGIDDVAAAIAKIVATRFGL
jgi:dTMP kinase